MKKIALLCLLLIPISCSKKDGETSQAEQELKEEKKTCAAKGTKFSGVYLVTGDATTGKCTDNDEEVPSPGTKFMVNCDQKDDSFKCKLVDKGDFSLDGCINEDGTFFTSSPTDLGFLGEGIVTVNATKEEKVTKLDGKIETDDGTGELTHSSVASRDKQKKGCNITWKVTLEKIGEDEQRDDTNDDGEGTRVSGGTTAHRELPTTFNFPARDPGKIKGMTWTLFDDSEEIAGYSHVGCHANPESSCDQFLGDTMCTEKLPVLCIEKSTSVSIGSTSKGPAHSLGNIQVTDAVEGTSLTSSAAADQICKTEFGDAWRMAEWHDSHGFNDKQLWGKGEVPSATRFWVHIDDQPANCWNK
jgi:hypothetical protein